MPARVRLWGALTLLTLAPQATAFAPAPTKQAIGDPLPHGASARLGSPRLRHGTWVNSLCFSPDGRTILASGGASHDFDHAVYLWDASNGKLRRRLPFEGSAHATAYSPDGKLVAAGGDAGVRVWEETGKELHRLEMPRGAGRLCFCPESKQLAILSGGSGKDREGLLLWQPGQKARRFERPGGWATALVFSPDGKQLAGSFAETKSPRERAYPVHVWDATTGKPLHQFDGHEDKVEAMAFTRDSRRLVTAGEGKENTVRIWDLRTGKERPALPDRTGEALALWLSADDRTLLVVDREGQLRGWGLSEGKVLTRLPKLTSLLGTPSCVAFSPDGKSLALGSPRQGHVIGLWDVSTGGRMLQQAGHETAVTDLGFTADGKRLASCGEDGVIVWDLRDRLRRPLRRLGSPEFRLETMALSPDGSTVAACSTRSEKVHLFDVASGKEFPVLPWSSVDSSGSVPRPPYVASWLRFSPDGQRLAASTEGMVLLWRLNTARRPRGDAKVLKTDERRLWPGGFSRDGKTILVGTDVGAIGWNLANWERTLQAGRRVDLWGMKESLGTGGALSPDGKLLAVSGNEGALVLWDTKEGKEVAWLLKDAKDRHKAARAVAFSPDGKTLVSGDRRGMILFWDVESRKELARHEGHFGPVLSLAFSSDGKTLASGGSDTTVLLWPVPERKE